MEGAAPVYGNSRARWCRGGQYFDGQGNSLTAAEAAMPEYVEPVESEVVEETVPSYSYGPVVVPPVKVESPIEVRNPVVIEPAVSREKLLAGMTRTALARLIRVAGGTPAVGKGSRAENIRWLLDNTTD